MRLALGTVTSNADATRSGYFKVSLGKHDSKTEGTNPVSVKYVTPYGSTDAGWIAIPEVGSIVLVGFVGRNPREPVREDDMGGYFYLGSIYGGMNSSTQIADVLASQTDEEVESIKDPRIMPAEFDEVYEAKGIIPEKIGLTSIYGDAFTINNRVRVDSNAGAPDGLKSPAFLDHRIEMRSGTGKKVKCVDTPSINAIIIDNNHPFDYFIWTNETSSGNNHGSGSIWWTTRGRVDFKTKRGNMQFEVMEGKNLELINSSSGGFSGMGPTPTEFGYEDTGCITLHSKHNNVIVKADEHDSIIRVHAPGPNTRVIVRTGGTVDIEADKDITITSGTKVQINAPLVDINGATEVDIDGGVINLN